MRTTPTLLISEDDPRLMSALVRVANAFGMVAIRDSDSRAPALAKLGPDVILLDLHQRVDGKELLARLKADPDTRSIPVVVMTGDLSSALRAQLLELGAIEFINKPFDSTFMARVSMLASICAETPP